MEMEEEYKMMDQITHYINRKPMFPPPARDLQYAMVMLGGGVGTLSFGSDLTTGMLPTTSGFSDDSGSGSGNGLYMDQIDGRWSKEETLALLDIRSRLDSQFKEANHKAHLWDQVSRIMYVDHGYKRSGKKCSVKFENLYKYYKKIKDGKTGKNGRQDKKHYRFFHQLEALHGETTNNMITNTNFSPNSMFSVTNATLAPFIEENDRNEKKFNEIIPRKKCWKTVITDYIEAKMNTLMEKQEEWMQKMMNTLEEKENERISKEVQRRKEYAAMLEMEKKFRSNELAWLQSRDSSLMEALQKFTKNESIFETSHTKYCNDQNKVESDWDEKEIAQLIQLRSCMETRFEEGEFMENVLWEEIALSMAGLGYNMSAFMCKAKWDHINFLLRNKKQMGWSSNVHYDHHNHIFHQVGER